MKPIFFKSEAEFRAWLDANFMKETELYVGYYKIRSGKPSMTWSQSVDQALCFGWIDGVRKSIDQDSYCIRFTPRRANSIWSTININKVEELKVAGLMKPEGLKAFELRKESKSGIYSHESDYRGLSAEYEAVFRNHESAWDYYRAQAPSYQKVTGFWVMTAKQEKTRRSRLDKLILASERGMRLDSR